ncbi:MAG: TetR/AcrR family transcriptional regulator [Deltaproteobacteria bacterium]|nr:TetR/AcrR family transcriptional regulator [Nannocystaceae bacterium]
MARTTREDWIDAGLTLLRESGEHALTLDRLCAALGRTKGSFYHHFAGMPELSRALLEAWEQRHTEVPIATASREDNIGKRRKLLDASVKQLDWALDLTVRAWALRDASARDTVARVDARRIDYLESLLPRRVSAARRRAIATLEYAAFLGAMQLDPMRTRGDEARSEALLYEALGGLIGSKR